MNGSHAGDDPNLITKIQDPFYLNQVAQTYKDVSNSINNFGPWSGAWVSESGGAYNSGGKDVSNTFANGFWFVFVFYFLSHLIYLCKLKFVD